MSDSVIVINPNSTEAVTAGIDEAVEPLRMAGGPAIECLTLAEGPPGIESQSDADSVIAPLCRTIKGRDNAASAFVVACFSATVAGVPLPSRMSGASCTSSSA